MQSFFRNDNVSRTEWRRVTFWGGLFAIITLLPFVWATIATGSEWHFAGLLMDVNDSASALSKIRDGINGDWLIQLRYTPETHEPAGLFPLYVVLGHMARALGFSELLVFHLARLATSMLMFASLYLLGATVWKRLRPRWLFFFLSILGSGMGWLVVTLQIGIVTPDLYLPEGFPLFAALTNPQYPLSIALLALIASEFLQAFRPGFREVPSAENGGLNILIYTTVLALIQPTALISIGLAICIFVIITSYRQRAVAWHEFRWFSMLFLPAFPVLFYYLLILNNNDTIRDYVDQYTRRTPDFFALLLGYGFLLVLAVPGIWRAVRRFDRDGDQIMLLWLVTNIASLYLPSNFYQQILLGLSIPIVFFVVRSIEEFWFEKIDPKHYLTATMLIFTLVIPSNIIAMVLPIYGAIINEESGVEYGILIDRSYEDTFDWLSENGNRDEVALASPSVSRWLPTATDLRVVYGHPFETTHASRREKQVNAFFAGKSCNFFKNPSKDYQIDYVIWGPRERAIAAEAGTEAMSEACEGMLSLEANLIVEFDDVTLYILREAR